MKLSCYSLINRLVNCKSLVITYKKLIVPDASKLIKLFFLELACSRFTLIGTQVVDLDLRS